MANILDLLTSDNMTVSLSGTALSMRKNFAEGAATVADDVGGDAEAFRVTRKLLPAGYDTEYKALVKAYNAVRACFYEHTVAFGMATLGDATRAKGDRLLKVSKIVDGSFQSAMDARMAELDTARDAFKRALPGVLARLQLDAKLGRTFNPDDYPTQDDIDKSFRWTLDGPNPIASGAQLSGMPLTVGIAEAIQASMERKAQAQVVFAQQTMANELTGYLKALAETTNKLFEHHNTPESQRGRAPRVATTLTTNVHDMVQKIRTYAIPETPQGAALLALADTVLERLEVDIRDADDIRENPRMAEVMARDAAEIISAIEALDMDFAPTF